MSTTVRLDQQDKDATLHAIWVGEGLAMDRLAVGTRSVCIMRDVNNSIAAVITPNSNDPVEDLEWAIQTLTKHLNYLQQRKAAAAQIVPQTSPQAALQPFPLRLAPGLRLPPELTGAISDKMKLP